jgi:UDP-N-acetylmuramyl pentapeptide phosphotransferase/UDP-N-acetylglucosamine-1-phosphate transferase
MNPALVITAVLTAATSFLAALAMTRFSARLGFTDLPNERSLHSRVTPRAGGVGFAIAVPIATAGTIAIAAGGLSAPILTFLLASLAIALVGLADDRWNLPVALRLLVQLAAAMVVVKACGLSFVHGLVGAVATIAIVAVTNIYNFMDGIDGIAGAQAVVAASCMALVASIQGRLEIAVAMWMMAAGVSGFLVLNWPPARIFMGDVGSTFLGFSFAGWSLLGARYGSPTIPIWAWALALSPFLFDGSYTLARRLLRGDPVHRAHRTHVYQRLVRGGWSHRRTTCLYALLAAWAGGWVILSGAAGTAPAVAIVVTAVPLFALPVMVQQVVTRNSGSES